MIILMLIYGFHSGYLCRTVIIDSGVSEGLLNVRDVPKPLSLFGEEMDVFSR